MPPVHDEESGALFNIAAKKDGGADGGAGPLAIITRPYKGGAACVNCGICSGYAATFDARSAQLNRVAVAQKNGRCEVRANSYVREISVDGNGRVTGVSIRRPEARIQQRAKAVVLSAERDGVGGVCCCSRTSPKFPNGLANSNGIVGNI